MRQYVGIALIKPDGSVLGQHRDNKPDILGPDTWCVIGGARDNANDKDLKAVVQRELEEETGYIVPLQDLRFLARDSYNTEKGTPVQRTILWAWYDGMQPIECREGQEIRFVSPSELNQLNIYTGHREFFRKAMEKVFTKSLEMKG